MANLLMLGPAAIASIDVSRGSGATNLLTSSPKEVWQDSAVGAPATIDIDFGAVRAIDTVFLGSVLPPAPGSTWEIAGGTATYNEVTLMPESALRAVDRPGIEPALSHGFWTGAAAEIRYLRITVTQPNGYEPLSIGNVMAGSALVTAWNKEWGAGRRVIDTGIITPLPDGGAAAVEGARKGSYSWTFGDLSDAEVDRIYALQLERGETRPLVVVEDPAATAGQLYRIHYCRFVSLRAYERRDPTQTRWELSVEDWL